MAFIMSVPTCIPGIVNFILRKPLNLVLSRQSTEPIALMQILKLLITGF